MDRKQHIAIFTTASLPWLTGTAVNPLFRAAYLAKDGDRKVTLVIPWLSLKHQKLVYPNNITFSSPSEHEAYVRDWLADRISFVQGFSICFYPGKQKCTILPPRCHVPAFDWLDFSSMSSNQRLTCGNPRFKVSFYTSLGSRESIWDKFRGYFGHGNRVILFWTPFIVQFAVDKRSILPVGDISEVIPDEEADVAILEEPEHLTWFHHGKRWKIKFRLVVGIVHTNYLEYVKREKNGRIKAFVLKYLNSWVVGIYCHKVIRLSAATQNYPNSVICNVHGVNPKFLEIGKRTLDLQRHGTPAFSKGAYYIGKMVWSKGYKELLALLHDHQKELAGLEVDLYGSGEDSDQVKEAAKVLELVVRVNPGRDHADPVFHDYKVFLNPSTTDVVCTTTAEALAMGKIVVCANHPSNEFFKQFPNCLTYDKGTEFVEATRKALAEQPNELTDAQRYALSWESATERFLRVAELDKVSGKEIVKNTDKPFASTSFNLRQNLEGASAYVHYVASGFEASRKVFGAIPGSLQPDEELCVDLGLPFPARN